ncbi:uncharacterized protein LOC144828825 [Lissotriton helveticus]
MGRRRAPEKKVTAQCSLESTRPTVPYLPLHDVSTSGFRKDTQRDNDLEPLSENLPHIILLSMLEELEAKLDNLMNTVEDVPSRVAGLIKKIWIEKDQGSLDNAGVTLKVVYPASIRDCAVSRSPATPQLDRSEEPSLCLQPVFSDEHAPKLDCTLSSPTDVQGRPEEPSLCLQPMFPDRHHPQQDQCVQPGFLGRNGVQQDCPLSRCPQTDPPCRSQEAKLCLPSEFVDGQRPEQDQSVQSAFPEEWEPDEPLKQEPSPLSANSWDQQQNLCPHPLFPDRHEPQQNHRIHPALPDGNGPDDPLEEELMSSDFQVRQENQCLQPVSPDGKSSDEHLESGLLSFDELGSQQTQCLQQHLCLKQELPYVQDPIVNYELESMRPEAQEPDKNDNLEPACTDAHGSDQNRKLKPPCTDAEGSDQNYILEPLHPESQHQHQNCKAELLCPDERGKSVPPSFLGLDTNTADEDSMERGNTKSHLLLFEATPAQQSHVESMNGKESHKGSGGEMNFTQNIYFKKRHRMHMRERRFACNVCDKGFISKTLLVKHKKGHTSLRPYPCETCKKCFTQKATFLQHQRTHTGEWPNHCTVCSKRFAYKKGLERHQSIHTGERPHQSVHTGERPHQIIHTGERPHQSVHTRERPHQSVHTGERPYHCTVCAKSFTRKKILLQHQRIHTGEKPYCCTMCEKSFNKKANLLRHQIKHTGEKPYHCNVCSKFFSQKANLVRHQRTHTREALSLHCVFKALFS